VLLDVALQVHLAFLLLELKLDHVFIEGLSVAQLQPHELLAVALPLLEQLVLMFNELDLLLQVGDVLFLDCAHAGLHLVGQFLRLEAIHAGVGREVETLVFGH